MGNRFPRLVAAVSIAAAVLAGGAKADQPVRFTAIGFQAITATASAQLLTVPAGTVAAVICVEVANIRWRDDGTAPTAAVGMPLKSTDACMTYTGPVAAWQFIAQSGSPIVSVAYYR